MGSLNVYDIAEKNSGATEFKKAWERKRKYRAHHQETDLKELSLD
jgi:hypothetical protein